MSAPRVHPLAGQPAPVSLLANIPRLITAYYTERPDPAVPGQRVAFGTSGHRGSSLTASFNEAHILAMTQAICLYRKAQGIDGPLFLGGDTHALTEPATASALEVLAANGVDVMLDRDDGPTPTPVISKAILDHNRGRRPGSPTASSSRPRITRPIPAASSTIRPRAVRPTPRSPGGSRTGPIGSSPRGLPACTRIPYERARRAPTMHRFAYVDDYVDGLAAVIDMARSAAARSGSASIRSAAPASGTGRPSPSATACGSRS